MKKIERSEGDVNLSSHRKKWIEEEIDAETKQILEEDSKYFLHQSLSTPCMNVLTGCEGSYIIDSQGRKYLDFHGNNVHQVGYANEEVIKAMINQMETLAFSPRRYTNETAIKLAKRLTELTPGNLNKVLFAPGGTSVVGMALKLARIATGRFKTVSWWDSFHGASLDSISVGGEALFRSETGPLLPGAIHVPPPNSYRSQFGNSDSSIMESVDYLEYVFEHEGDISAFIAEPIRYTSAQVPSKSYWKRVREICDKYEALLIFDEIPSCLGRTGKMFVFENFEIEPDILCIGKGLGGGIFPMAAMIAKEELDIAAHKSLGHYTHEKSPVGSAAALATIEYILDNNLLKSTNELGQFFIEELEKLKNKYELIGDVRGIGLLTAVELVKNRDTKEPAIDESEALLYKALRKGLSFKVSMGNVLTLMPPLTITYEELNKAVNILDSCFEEISEELSN